MLDESDATRLWQQRFHDQPVTSHTLAKAESLVGEMHAESPLRLRLSVELEEIRSLHQAQRAKRTL